MFPLLEDTASQKVPVILVDEYDRSTREAGVTSPTITISKAGGALAAPNDGTWTELAGGAYTITLNATDTDTVGPLLVRVVKDGCYDAFVLCYVRANTEKQVYDAVGTLNDLSAAEVNSEVDTALSDINLDHLMKVAVTGGDVVDNSALAKLASKSATADWDSFNNTTDSLEALSDATVSVDASAIAAAVWDLDTTGHDTEGTFGEAVLEGPTGEFPSLEDIAGEVADALVDIGLDHIVSASVADTDVADNSIIARICSKNTVADFTTFSHLTDSLEAIRDRGDAAWLPGMTGAGSGAIKKTYTLTKADGVTPIADADVWVSTDEDQHNIVASKKTDQYGQVTFYLDAGTVYIWRQKSGFNFTNPDIEVVSA